METLRTQRDKVIFVSPPKNYTGAAATTEWISMKNYDRIRFIIQTGAWAGGTAAVTLKQAKDVSGTSSAALAFSHYWTNDGSTSTDTLTKTTAASSTFNLDTASALYVVEVNASDLSIASSMDCVAIAVASPGANNDLYSIIAEAYGARYEQGTPPTAITD